MLALPTKPGDSTIIWSDDGHRIRCERVAADKWLLHTECVEGEEAGLGGVPSKALRGRIIPTLALAFREHADLFVFQFMAIEAKGSTTVPKDKPVKVVRSRGWFVEMINEGGLYDGDIAVRLNFKRPLSATEMLVFLKRLAVWADARAAEGWEE